MPSSHALPSPENSNTPSSSSLPTEGLTSVSLRKLKPPEENVHKCPWAHPPLFPPPAHRGCFPLNGMTGACPPRPAASPAPSSPAAPSVWHLLRLSCSVRFSFHTGSFLLLQKHLIIILPTRCKPRTGPSSAVSHPPFFSASIA